MKNETISRKDVLELGENGQSVSGYVLVVYRKGTFKTIISNGDSYKPSFFERNIEIVGIIDSSVSRLVTFKSTYHHTDNVHQFSLEFTLSYRVANARLLADKRTQDPLKKVMGKIKHTVGAQVGKIHWDQLYNSDAADFHEIKNQILSYETMDLNGNQKSISTIIKTFANTYGLELTDIDFRFIVPEGYVLQKKEREKSQINREIKDINHNDQVQDLYNKGELDRLKAQNESSRLHYSLYDAVETAVKNVGSSIDNPEKFLQAVKAGIDAQNLVQTQLIRSPQQAQSNRQIASGGAPVMQLGIGATPTDNFAANSQYMQVISTLKEANISYEERTSFFAKYIRLVAATLEDNTTQEESIIDELIDLGLPTKLTDLIQKRVDFSTEIKMILQ